MISINRYSKMPLLEFFSAYCCIPVWWLYVFVSFLPVFGVVGQEK